MKMNIPPRNTAPVHARAENGTSGLAWVSLIFGILGWLLLPLIGALTAVITGHMARAEIRRTGKQGDGMAIAGLILGYLWWALLIPILGILAAIALPAYQDYTHQAKAHAMHQQLLTVRQSVAAQLHSGVSPHEIDADEETTLQQLGVHRVSFDAARIDGGVVQVRYAHHETVPEPMRGEVLFLVPEVAADGTVRWHCEGSLKRTYQPVFCRGHVQE